LNELRLFDKEAVDVPEMIIIAKSNKFQGYLK
jgi:hypothetical protein